MWFIMADVTLSSRTLIQPYRSRAGSPRITSFPVASTRASTAAVTAGVVVQFDLTSTSHHKIIRCSSGVATALQSTTICGVAAQADPADGSVDPKISVWVADANTEFIFPTKIAGTASSNIGTPLSLCWDSTLNINYAMASSSAGTEGIWCTDVINPGDTNGYIVGRFFSTRVSPAVWSR
jgi:hypothetical protein